MHSNRFIFLLLAATSNAQFSVFYDSKYPPAKFSVGSSTLTISSGSYGKGIYSISSSSTLGLQHVSNAFDSSTGTFWASAANYNASGHYVGDQTTQTDRGAVKGEWIQINTPRPIIVSRSLIYGVLNYEVSLAPFDLYCTNTSNTNWFHRQNCGVGSSVCSVPYSSKMLPMYCDSFRLVFPAVTVNTPGKSAYSMVVADLQITAAVGKIIYR